VPGYHYRVRASRDSEDSAPAIVQPLVEHRALLLGSAASLLVVLATATGAMTWGSQAGGWVYPYIRGFNPASLLVFCLASVSSVGVAAFAASRIESRPTSMLLICLASGIAIQALLRWPAPFPLEILVRSDAANSFYTASLRYSFADFLELSTQALSSLPFHARHNMPGKVSLYIAFGALTRSPFVMGSLVMAVSSLGGVLVYAIVHRLADRRTGLFALFFYLFLPCRHFFFPVLNTVSAVPILLCLWLHLRFLQRRKLLDALWFGMVVYGVIFFDPLPLAMGVLFAALAARAIWCRELSLADIGREVGAVLLGFGIVYAGFLFGFGYEIFTGLAHAVREAAEFNSQIERSYWVWLVNNPAEFGLGVGAIQVAIFVSVSSALFRVGSGSDWLARMTEPATLIAGSLLVIFVILELLGVNRGEVIRLWIFLASFVPIVTAMYCARTPSLWPFGIVLGLMILETVVPLSMIGFVIPGDLLRAQGAIP
jgi:hypothetical protein